jgi:photosystem II stability/assembly factor-like uncharacterized protein
VVGSCTSSHRSGPGSGATTGTPASAASTSSSTTAAAAGGSTSCPSPPGQLVPDDDTYAPLLGGIQMVSPDRGWVVGKGLILATTDGSHWQRQYDGAEPFMFVDAVDGNHVWAVGRRHLFGTSDGGRHWAQLGRPPAPLRSVHFVDAKRGFGVAGFPSVVRDDLTTAAHVGELVQTFDGGLTWEALSAPCHVESVCFSTLDDGWLLTSGEAYRSEDGGGHWRQVFRFPRGDGWFATVQCARPHAAWVLLESRGGALSHSAHVAYRSGDGGATWRALFVEGYTNVDKLAAPETTPGSYPGPFSVVGPSEAVFVGWTPPVDNPTATMTVTQNGQKLGEVRTVPLAQLNPSGASFVSLERGWLVGTVDGTGAIGATGARVILATSDGGRTWTTQYRLP